MSDSMITIEQIELINGFRILRIINKNGYNTSKIQGLGKDTQVWSTYSKRDLQYMFIVRRDENWIDLRDESQDEVIRFDSALVHIQYAYTKETDETN